MRLLIAGLFLLLIGACRPETYIPKPRGFAKIDTPQHSYQTFDRSGFPYSFEYPKYGEISQDTLLGGRKPDNPWWINLNFPKLGGTIYISYKIIDATHTLDHLLNDSHEISYFITKRADYMNTPAFHTVNNVHGVMYAIGGNAASAYQFFATDSTRHFLRGALYFNTTPNADSLKPVTDFLHTDMVHLIETLRWK